MKIFWSKIQFLVLIASLVVLPTQLTYFLWLKESYVAGVAVDYLAIKISLALLGMIVCILVFGREIFQTSKKVVPWFVLWAGLNIWLSGFSLLTIWGWVCVVIYINYILVCFVKRDIVINNLKWIIPVWVGVELFLALGQVAGGSSIGGGWWWLGERRFSYINVGVATWRVWGEVWVRAYGTFSHPNSLAGFFAVIFGLWLGYKRLVTRALWWIVCMGIGVLLFLAGSRGAVMAILMSGVLVSEKYRKSILVVGMFGIVGSGVFLGGWDSQSLDKRVELYKLGAKTFVEHPLGLGINKSIVEMYRLSPTVVVKTQFQPIHSVYGLFILEWGVMAIPIIWILWRRCWKNLRYMSVGIIIFLMVWDHFLYTQIQNIGLFCVVAGIYWDNLLHERNLS